MKAAHSDLGFEHLIQQLNGIMTVNEQLVILRQ
ncbi:MAG: hypothetical protein ACI910_000064 [Oleispira sp.]|jgi:hypothetical protein